jgi:PIN domain nuclease of toxin-antitoxin system
MRYLLDTHSLIWFLGGKLQLSNRARELIDDETNELFISVASLWEMAIKWSIGKLNLGQPFDEMFPAQLQNNSIEVLGISLDHLIANPAV